MTKKVRGFNIVTFHTREVCQARRRSAIGFLALLAILIPLSAHAVSEDIGETVTHRGWFFKKVFDLYSQSYVRENAFDTRPTLEIGFGGSATAPAVLREKLRYGTPGKIYLNDLVPAVFEQAIAAYPFLKNDLVNFVPGIFPNEIQFPDHYFGTILASRIFHFIPENQWRNALEQIYRWLKPGGKFYITAGTYFIQPLKDRIESILEAKAAGSEWPASFRSGKDAYGPLSISGDATLIDLDILQRELTRVGFKIVLSSYLDARPLLPPEFCLDGREAVGAIAIK